MRKRGSPRACKSSNKEATFEFLPSETGAIRQGSLALIFQKNLIWQFQKPGVLSEEYRGSDNTARRCGQIAIGGNH